MSIWDYRLSETVVNAKADWIKACEHTRQCSSAVMKTGNASQKTTEYKNALITYWAALDAEKKALSKYRSVMAKERFRKDKAK